MTEAYSGSPVPRDTVFILTDGSFVVRWDQHRVQELLSGRYRDYQEQDFGHSITDYELNQLQAAGRVEHYNQHRVWLNDLPESVWFRADESRDSPRTRVRNYYLNTTLPASRLPDVETVLAGLGLLDEFLARVRGELVAVLGKNGAPFHELPDAERAQKQLVALAPEVFENTAIAFIETAAGEKRLQHSTAKKSQDLDLDSIFSGQGKVSLAQGKRVLLVTGDDKQREAFESVLVDMKMVVAAASTASEALQLLEDFDPDLLIMDTLLPDMHGWEVLAKIKEIGVYDKLPKILIADHHAPPEDHTFALTVGKVDVYLMKPMSMAQLRQNVWLTLKNYADAKH